MKIVGYLVGRIAIALACVATLSHCASLPDAPAPGRVSQDVRISTKSGWLTYDQSQRMIERLAKGPVGQDFLAEHLRVEEAISGTPLVTGNRVTLFDDGPSTYRAMGRAIEGAKHFIHLESYIYEDDEVGNKLTDLLIAKRREGVAVAVMVDDLGTLGVPSTMFDKMRAAGIPVVFFNPIDPLKSRNGWSLNQRSHRKILVVDGKIGFVGGINVSSVYSSRPGFGSSLSGSSTKGKGNARPWRDTQVSIEGPAASQIEQVFLSGWKSQKGPELPPIDYTPRQDNKGPQVVRILENNPGDNDTHAIYLTLLSAISSSQQFVHITMAYFVPDPAFLKALADAALRGVDVTLILPSFTDSSLVLHAGRSYYGQLLEAGVKIYERKGALLHAKTAVVDGVWSTAGSSNLDWRSFTLNHEINAVILGSEFGGEMERLFQADLGASRHVILEEWNRRPASDRFMEFIGRLGERWL